jgi:hypothetical protein
VLSSESDGSGGWKVAAVAAAALSRDAPELAAVASIPTASAKSAANTNPQAEQRWRSRGSSDA